MLRYQVESARPARSKTRSCDYLCHGHRAHLKFAASQPHLQEAKAGHSRNK